MTEQVKSFGEVLGEDLQDIKLNLSKVIDKANTPSNVDQELRDLLLTKRDSFIKWLKSILDNEEYILTRQDTQIINRGLFDYDVVEELKRQNSEYNYINKLLSKKLDFIIHPIISSEFNQEYYAFLNDKYRSKTVFELQDIFIGLLKSEFNTNENFVRVNYSQELFNWFIFNMGDVKMSESFNKVIELDIDKMLNNTLFDRFVFSNRFIDYNFRDNFFKLISLKPELKDRLPICYIMWDIFRQNNTPQWLQEEIKSSVVEKLNRAYWDWNTGDYYFYNKNNSTNTNYIKADHSYLHSIFENLNDDDFYKVFDQLANNKSNDQYFMPLFCKLPMAGYDDLWNLANVTNNTQPITNFKQMYELVLSTKNTRINQQTKDKIKVQLDSLYDHLKYLRNDSPYLHRLKYVFKNSENKNLANWWYKLSYERFHGLSPIFLYMMDSGDYTEFFKLVTDIEEVENRLKGWLNNANNANNSNQCYLYMYIPWIATNRLNRISYLSELETLPLFQRLKTIQNSDFNNFWVQLEIRNAIDKKTDISSSTLNKMKTVTNYETLISEIHWIYRLKFKLEDSVTLTEKEVSELNQVLKTPITKNTITFDELNNFVFSMELDTAVESETANIFKSLDLISFRNYPKLNNIVNLCKNKEDRFKAANNFKAFCNNAKVIYNSVSTDTKNWKKLNSAFQDSTSNIGFDYRNRSNNFTKPVIIFFSLGMWSNPNKDQVMSIAMAQNSPTNTSISTVTRANLSTTPNAIADNVGIRPDTDQKIIDNMSGVWFGEAHFGEWGDGFIGAMFYEYIGE